MSTTPLNCFRFGKHFIYTSLVSDYLCNMAPQIRPALPTHFVGKLCVRIGLRMAWETQQGNEVCLHHLL